MTPSTMPTCARIIPAYAGQIYPFLYLLLFLWDHPRIRGTNEKFTFRSSAMSGSSPHTRDKLFADISCQLHIRIIPAYAGQILRQFYSGTPFMDHPRIRGTNPRPETGKMLLSGSSPHTRDKFHAVPLAVLGVGIIPAYAGQILLLWDCLFYQRDHPRIRGTNVKLSRQLTPLVGSSPHTRDKSKPVL